MINVKLVVEAIWEAVVLPCIRFIIGYLPMLAGVFVAMEGTIKYFVTSMMQYEIFEEWLGWYMPTILIVTIVFTVMATKASKIHSAVMILLLMVFLIAMKMGVSEMQISLYFDGTPTVFESLFTSVTAVSSVYCVALIIQRAWMGFLPKRRKR